MDTNSTPTPTPEEPPMGTDETDQNTDPYALGSRNPMQDGPGFQPIPYACDGPGKCHTHLPGQHDVTVHPAASGEHQTRPQARDITPEELAAMLGVPGPVGTIRAHIEETRDHIETSVDGLITLYASPDRLEPQSLRMAHTADLFRHDGPAAAVMLAAMLERLAAAHQGRTAATGSNVTGSDLTPGETTVSDDPADLDAITAEYPDTTTEVLRRLHLGPFMFDMIDPAVEPQVRVNALRHLAVCDSWRAIAGLAALVIQTSEQLAAAQGTSLAEVVAQMRYELGAVAAAFTEQEG